VYFGGVLGFDVGFGCKVCGYKVIVDDFVDYVECVVRCYVVGCCIGEWFVEWVVCVDDEVLL